MQLYSEHKKDRSLCAQTPVEDLFKFVSTLPG